MPTRTTATKVPGRKTATGTRRASPTDEGVTVNVALPTDLHRRLRLRALRDGVHMKDALADAVRVWLRS